MTQYVIPNNVNTTLSSSASSSATSLDLASSSNLPSLGTGQVMPLTLNDAATGQVYEIVYVTAISGTTLTVERGKENTTAQSWSVGDYAYTAPTSDTVAVSTGDPNNTFQAAQAQNNSEVVNYGQAEKRYRNASNLDSGTVPTARMSGTYPISISGTAAQLGGNAPSFYRNASNLNSGTVPTGRLSGTYSINISGSAAQLGGNSPSFYRNANNLNAGTVPNARLNKGTVGSPGIVPLDVKQLTIIGSSTPWVKIATISNPGTNKRLVFQVTTGHEYSGYSSGNAIDSQGTALVEIVLTINNNYSTSGDDWCNTAVYGDSLNFKNQLSAVGTISNGSNNSVELWGHFQQFTNLACSVWGTNSVGLTLDGTIQSSQPSNLVTKTITHRWNSANDGSGSGLDADLLDGYQARHFSPNLFTNVSNQTSNRSNGTTYTNSSGKPMLLSIDYNDTGNVNSQSLQINGNTAQKTSDFDSKSGEHGGTFVAIVPVGATYESLGSNPIAIWLEIT